MCVPALPFPPKNGGRERFSKTLGKGRGNVTISDEAEAGRGGESCPALSRNFHPANCIAERIKVKV
jgi:hypothetical protein